MFARPACEPQYRRPLSSASGCLVICRLQPQWGHVAFEFYVEPTSPVSPSRSSSSQLPTHSPAFSALQSQPPCRSGRGYFGIVDRKIDPFATPPQTASRPFPFPGDKWETHPALESAGHDLLRRSRATLMVRARRRPDEDVQSLPRPERDRTPEIQKLRELHAAMDRVGAGRLWLERHLRPTASSFLDYEIDEETWGKREETLPIPLARRKFTTRCWPVCSI